MHEAIRALHGKALSWLSPHDAAEPEAPRVPTPLESAETLIQLANAAGQIDRQSGTWHAVARWAALELITTRDALETATDDRAAGLRARARTLREVLEMNERGEQTPILVDQGPFVP